MLGRRRPRRQRLAPNTIRGAWGACLRAGSRRQNVMDKTNAAPDPAHRARVFDPIAKWRIGCRAQALGLFGGDDDRLKLVECPGQTGTAASLSRIQSKCE